MAVACVSCALEATCTEVSLIVATRLRSCSTAKLIESAIAPVMSSVTVAFTVRSPSASEPISSSRRMIASWLRSLSSFVVSKRCCCARYNDQSKPTIESSASAPETKLTSGWPIGLVLLTEPKDVSASNRPRLSLSSASDPLVICAAADWAANRFLRDGQDGVQVLAHVGPQHAGLVERGDRGGVGELLHVGRTAVAQALQHVFEHVGIALERVAGQARRGAAGADLRDALGHGGGEHHLAQGDVDLRGRARRPRTSRARLRRAAPAAAGRGR
jgi:hypothetical protein